MHRKVPVRFGPEVAGKGPRHGHLAGGLPVFKVAIRSPGDKPWTRKTEILEYRTFYGVLQEMARELRRRGVTHVVMEASGVYTEPVYYALAGPHHISQLTDNRASKVLLIPRSP
jgi:transposase